VSYLDKVVVGCATGYFNPKTSKTITCETINSFKEFDKDQFPCTPISCSVEALKSSLPPYINVQAENPNVAFDKTATISCHNFNNEYYFSKKEENYQVEYKCETPTSFEGKTGSELECAKCTKVDGCSVAETCTTASNSKCADCSGLVSNKGAYRKVSSTDKATVCTKCGGLNCEDNTEVLLTRCNHLIYTASDCQTFHALFFPSLACVGKTACRK